MSELAMLCGAKHQKLEAAREQRRIKRQQTYQIINNSGGTDCPLTQVA
jgi:hypothetical protein